MITIDFSIADPVSEDFTETCSNEHERRIFVESSSRDMLVRIFELFAILRQISGDLELSVEDLLVVTVLAQSACGVLAERTSFNGGAEH